MTVDTYLAGAPEPQGYDWSKGTLRFPVDKAPDIELVRRLVEIRLAMLAE